MEKDNAIIVDKDDNIISSKPRGQIDYSKDIYRSSSLLITNNKGQILIAKRKLTKDKDPGLWGPAVAGTVEEGETYESNVYKEAEEEIGLTGAKFDIGPKHYEDKPRKHFTQWFLHNTNKSIEDFTIQEDEVEQIMWMDKNVLISDIQKNPDKYVRAFKKISQEFLKSVT